MTFSLPGYALFREMTQSPHYVVYQGIRESDQKPVLVKMIYSERPTLEEIGNLKNEYETTRTLQDESIIKPILFDKTLNQFYLIFEDKGFEPLSRIEKTNNFSLRDKLKISIGITKALWDVQKQRIIHKDIQPKNIFVHPETLEVLLTGFGLSTKLARQKLLPISSSQNISEVAYISPEQTGRMNREIDYRTDFYSLGVVFYELFCGVKPFESTDTLKLIHAHLAQIPLAPSIYSPSLPVPISEIIMKLLSKGAYDRYFSASSLMRDLERCLSDLTKSGNIEPFKLGVNDVSPTLQVSHKLYGREKELGVLYDLLDETPASPPHLCLIGGFSGIGKSSLIYDLQKPVIERGGFFIRGKFDQFKTNIPYSGFIEALEGLIQQILTESEDKIDFWKFKIQKSLGMNAGVITEVIPDLKLIIGEPPRVPQLDTEQTYNRFSLLFQHFITTFSTPETPLVMFIDDLQWIDMASQKLIEVLMMSYQTKGLLLLGAFRNNEIDNAHSLKILANHIKESNPNRITEIEVSPLSQDNISELLVDTLHQETHKVADLAKVIKDKTQGNPFFITQLLIFLFDEKLLTFDANLGVWKWDIETVKNAQISDNIVTLLLSKLKKCTPETQQILKLAACTGHSFDLDILSSISSYSKQILVKSLKEALEEGLIVAEGQISESFWQNKTEIEEFTDVEAAKNKWHYELFKFSHDRVQQAIYSLISPDKQREIHLTIGKILTQRTGEEELDDKIFDIVYQINRAVLLIEDPEEKLLYARYNLMAGIKAMNSVAYRTAFDYLKIGYSLLPNDRWDFHYELAYPLEVRLAECAFLIDQYDDAEKLFNHALEVAKTDDEKIEVYTLKIKLLVSSTKYLEAIDNGRQALKILGIDLPKKISKFALLKEMGIVKYKLLWQDSLSILNLPEIKDTKKQQILLLIFILVAPAYLSAKEFYAFIVLKGVRLCLDWGHTPYTGYFFGGYGVILNILFHDMEGLKQNGQLALELCQRFTNQVSVPATKFLVGTFITPYYQHIRHSIQVLESSFETGILVGDLIYGVYSLAQLMANQFISSMNLDDMQKEIIEYREFVSKIKAHNRGYMFVGAQQTILALRGNTTAPWLLDSENFSEKDFFKSLTENNFPLTLYFVYTYKMLLGFLFEKYDLSLEAGKEAEKINFAVRGHPINTERDFYYALSLTQKNETLTQKENKELKRILKQLKTYSEACPENYLFKYCLILAERKRMQGNKEEASEYYDKAIESAKENNFIQFSGMANELFAKFWLSLNKSYLAKQYLIEAHYAYYRWGATRKVKWLEERYPHILMNGHQAAEFSLTGNENKIEAAGLKNFDITAIFKASEIITGQLDLNVLMEDLIKIMIENAGAERAVLVLQHEGKWTIKAEGTKDSFNVNQDIPLDKSAKNLDLSSSVIYYVIRTKESLVLDNASLNGLFTADPYITTHSVKSILALPLMHQGIVTGALWLENNLTTNAFTPQRVELLRLLSAQIANSIENARLYTTQMTLSKELKISNSKLEDYTQNLEKKVYLRTHELKEKNEQLQVNVNQIKKMQNILVQQEKLVSLGAITKSIATEVRNPLSFVSNFAKMAKELLDDMKTTPDPEIINQVGINLDKIAVHAEKADEIITRMVEESRTTDLTKIPTDVNKLIRDYADLVYYNYYKKDPQFVLSIETHWDSNLEKVPLVPHNIGKVIYGIIDNACYSTDLKKKSSSDHYTPTLSISTEKKDSSVIIKIKDNGVGIPKELLENIFTSYRSSKPSDKGAGMGLALSHDIIAKEHSGTISISSDFGHWAEVEITLPLN